MNQWELFPGKIRRGRWYGKIQREGDDRMTGFQTAAAGLFLVMDLAAFLAYGADKRRAVRKQWRIPESTLLLLTDRKSVL